MKYLAFGVTVISLVLFVCYVIDGNVGACQGWFSSAMWSAAFGILLSREH